MIQVERLHGCWTDENRASLESLLRQEQSRAPIAVFDWDNTCIRGDIGDTLFHHLALDLALHFEHPQFWDWMVEAMPINLVGGAYEEFCAHRNDETRRRLRVALERQRQRLYAGPDDPAACAWDAGAFLGWVEDEARAYIRRAVETDLARSFRIELLEDDEGEEITVSWGLRRRREVEELVRAFQGMGWEVWVISGSFQPEVEAMAALYGIPRERVVAMRREVIDGTFSPTVMPPVPFSDGKLDAYRMFVSRHQPPQFAAGDSVNDWKLLEFADQVRLLVEPVADRLREYAKWRAGAGENWLVQAFE